jgi:membrane protease YdiL (CAAX protease family)
MVAISSGKLSGPKMNILVLIGVTALAMCLLWGAQSIALTYVGEPLALPLQYTTRSPVVRMTSQVMIQAVWIIILVGTPIALGINPLDALQRAFPLPVPWRQIATAFLIAFIPLSVGYALFVKGQWLRFAPKHDRATRRRKLFSRFLTPIPLAVLEEAVFRGTLLEQLLRSLPATLFGSALAVIVSSATFAAVHFIKPARGKPVLQGLYSYFTAGCLFGIGYIVGGRCLWIPVTLHATAIFIIEVARLYTVHQAPRWLAGFPEGPHSGIVGSLVVVGMAIALVMLI